ncbi:MAG: hypothetical protein GSR77_00295 [Desulfurococcales archaeon]|nr:hypothetical protein [Desulfurococcales archaeon]
MAQVQEQAVERVRISEVLSGLSSVVRRAEERKREYQETYARILKLVGELARELDCTRMMLGGVVFETIHDMSSVDPDCVDMYLEEGYSSEKAEEKCAPIRIIAKGLEELGIHDTRILERLENALYNILNIARLVSRAEQLQAFLTLEEQTLAQQAKQLLIQWRDKHCRG